MIIGPGAGFLDGKDGRLQLYLTHRRALVDYATPIVGDRMRAEDVVQEAFIRFTPAEPAGPQVEQPVSYLYRIVRNLALDWSRRSRAEQHRNADARPWWTAPAAPRTPEQELIHRRDLVRIADILAGLSPQARTAVEMHRFGGHTLQEVADHLGISVATAHRLVRDALLRIARDLGPADG